MTDLAALGLSVRSDGVVTASDRLDKFKGASDRAGQGADGLGRKSDGLGTALRKLAGIAGGVAATLVSMFSVSRVLSAAEAYETRMARVQAVITATGGVAGRTAEQLERQAQALARASLESVDGVMNAQQVLLTFRNVQGDVFDRAIEGAADLAAAMGQDIVSSTRQLARALEDPISGVTALTRSGTVFTEQQRDMIRAMVETGRVADAQRFILDELEAQYGGVSRAASRLASAKDSLGQSFTNLLIGIADVTGATAVASAAIETLDGAVQFLGENIGIVRGMVIAVALALTVSYAPAIAAAALATAGWVASLVTLKGALIATGIGALVVGAGILIDFLIRLRQATGSWGEALSALGDLASGVWEGIKTSALAIPPALASVWEDIKAGFMGMLAELSRAWSDFLHGIARVALDNPMIPESVGLDLFGTAVSAGSRTYQLEADFNASRARADELRAEAAGMVVDGFDKARDALDRLRETTRGGTEETTEQADAARALKEELDGISSGGGRAAGAVDDLTDSLKEAETVTFDLGDGLAGVFTDALTGVKNLQDGLRDLLKQMANMFLNQAFSNILGNIFPSLSGISFGGGREGGGPVSAGTAYVVGEKRPELFVPGQSGTIIPNIPQGGGTVVQVINNTGQPAREERQTLPDGRQIVRTIIGEEVGNGGIDRQMNGRFGLAPQAVRR